MFLLHVASDRWWAAWYPEVVLVVGGVVGIYWFLVEPVRHKYNLAPQVDKRYVVPFLLAMLCMLVAEATPIHALSEQFLFSVHMFQHIVLALVMPPLLVMALPPWLLAPLLRIKPVYWVARVLTNPILAIVLFNGVYAAWHLPGAYEMALYNHNMHIVQHIILVFTSVLMWWSLVSRSPELPPLPDPVKLIYLFFVSVAQIATYGYVTFNNALLYDFYARAPRVFPLSPLEDQILAGIVMKLGSMVVFVPLLIAIFFRWANREEGKARPKTVSA